MTFAEDQNDWLPALVEFTQYGGDWHAYEEALYAYFRADFVDSVPTYPGRRWAMKRHPVYRGKEATFWHIISEGPQEATRLPDLRRCERIRWPRSVIDACRTGRICLWEQKRGAETRIAIATGDFGYLVVLADRGSYVLLWTAFVVDREHQRRKLEREYTQWNKGREHTAMEKS
jgi:hypothetical protein